jgi:hypothetical protein
MEKIKITPLSLFHKLKWDLHKSKVVKDKQIMLETMKLLTQLPTSLIPKSIKEEIMAIVLFYGTDMEESYKVYKKVYERKPKDVHTLLIMMTLAGALGDTKNFNKYNDIIRSLTPDSDILYYNNKRNYLTLEEGNHTEARAILPILTDLLSKKIKMPVKYIDTTIEEATLKLIEGPVYVYNNLIMKDGNILIIGGNMDENIFKSRNQSETDQAIEITTSNNFFYSGPSFSNHYHALIEHLPIYNFVACRFPDWNYYKITNDSDTPENNYNGFLPIKKDTLYLFKEGLYTMVLPRTKVPTLFDTYRPPDEILKEYRDVMLKHYSDRITDRPNKERAIIYLQRVGPRQFDYDDDLIKRLRDLYPSFVVFTGTETESQADVFLNAKMIFGPHGAGFANMLYVPSDCIIYEVGMNVEDNFFGSLASTFNLKRYYKDPELKVRYYCKLYLDKYKTDLIILNIQRLLGDTVSHITSDSL